MVAERVVESVASDLHDQPNLVIRSLGLALYQASRDLPPAPHSSRSDAMR